MHRLEERPSVDEFEAPLKVRDSKLKKICRNDKFLIFVCILSVLDALIVVSELTTEVLAIKMENDEVCDTREVLSFLRSKYKEELGSFYENHTIEDILKVVREHNEHQHSLHSTDDGPHKSVTKRPFLTTTIPLLTRPPRQDNSTGKIRDGVKSVDLYSGAHYLRYGSIAILAAMFLLNFVRMYALRSEFFHSKLQVIDALVVVISLSLDIVFLPYIWNGESLTTKSLPIIIGLTWRVVRVVNNSLINLKEKDKIQIKRLRTLLKISLRKNRQRKAEIFNLKGLAVQKGVSDAEIKQCAEIKKIIKRSRRNSVTSALESMASFMFASSVNTDLPHLIEQNRSDSFNEHLEEGGDKPRIESRDSFDSVFERRVSDQPQNYRAIYRKKSSVQSVSSTILNSIKFDEKEDCDNDDSLSSDASDGEEIDAEDLDFSTVTHL